VLELGYPRNDVLQRPMVDAVRAHTRASLGLADDETVVLYAPTFRDRMLTDRGTPLKLALDVARLTADLGPGVRVLTRVHYFMTDRLERFQVPGVLDVYFLAGRNDFQVHLAVADPATLRDFVVKNLSAVPDVAMTETNLIFEHVRPRPDNVTGA
jgi:CDP-glycerol glycerophosphotransferase (TagB/SpsB family)